MGLGNLYICTAFYNLNDLVLKKTYKSYFLENKSDNNNHANFPMLNHGENGTNSKPAAHGPLTRYPIAT